MNTNHTSQIVEKINLLAAGLITAAGVHTALNLFSFPSALASATPGALGIIFTALKLSWTAAGFFAGAYVCYLAIFIVNARNFTKARAAAIGALALPFVGVTGLITAFGLIPLGAALLLLLRLPEWQAVFGIEPPAIAPDAAVPETAMAE